MKQLTTFLLLMCLSIIVFAKDEPVIIKGIIKDAETKELIPFAHVIVGNQVTISNINGEFAIPIKPEEEKIELKVSYLGYENHVEEIKNFAHYYEIFITQSTTQLDDVVVLSGPGIMQRVFNNFHLNYLMEPLQLEGYYVESLSDSAGYCYVTEGIMDIYTPSNLDKYGIPWVHPQRARRKIYRPIPEEEFLAGNASDMAHFSIWRFDSFLQPHNRDNYEYFYDGASKIGEHHVLKVDFEPKNRRGNTTGTMYIDDITHAIMKIEYAPDTKRSDFWGNVTWKEEYELINGSFQLVSVAYQGSDKNSSRTFDALLVINDTKVNYEIPEDKMLLGTEIAFFEFAEDHKTPITFWQGYNAIKLNKRVASEIQQQDFGF